MVFNPDNKRKITCASFPLFTLAGCKLQFLDYFHYLGQVIDYSYVMIKTFKEKVKHYSLDLTFYVVALNVVRCKLN